MTKTTVMTALLGIAVLTASTAQAEDATFNNPKFKGYAYDWCLNWIEVGCGAPAALAYCKYRGYKTLTGFKKREDPGKKTRLMRSNKICDLKICDTFQFISCR